jgi:hypothetical protein
MSMLSSCCLCEGLPKGSRTLSFERSLKHFDSLAGSPTGAIAGGLLEGTVGPRHGARVWMETVLQERRPADT